MPHSRGSGDCESRAVSAPNPRKKGFTEPVTLSSTVPTDFPPSALRLPRTAFGDDFNLLASRARCGSEPMGWRALRSRGLGRNPRIERKNLFSGRRGRALLSDGFSALDLEEVE